MNAHSSDAAASAPVTRSITLLKSDVIVFFILAALVLFSLMPHEAFADTASTSTSSMNGDTIWSNYKACLFGGWGLTFAGLIGAISVYIWSKRGIGEALVILSGGFALFFIPALLMTAMNAGKSMAGS